MSRNYDNWERLVAAVIKKQQFLELCHAHSRSPSDLSKASSDFSSSSFSSSPYNNNNLQQADPAVKKPKNRGLVFVSDYRPIVNLDDLLGASSVEILGEGTFSSVRAYKLNYATVVVVKRLMNMVHISEGEFKTRMGIIGEVKHKNVAALRAYYYSKDEKLMIYDYNYGGSVSALLHGIGKRGKNQARVDWNMRLRIATGAAWGIHHIHTQNGGNLVHGNIKSSNIFLNSQGYGMVTDLGLASVVSTTLPQSARCYAPEVKHTRNVSQASDVYGFGILLLELLTRKSPDLTLGRQAVDLAKLANSISCGESGHEVFDGDLLLNPSIREQIARMLEIGIRCVAKSPQKRPKMSAIVKIIEGIGMMNERYHQVSVQTERNQLIFLGDANMKFDLQGLMSAPFEVLGKGTFGVSYKEILNGITVSVKRLKDVILNNEEFQQHMGVIGRIGHKNVAEVKGYYYSEDEKLLVYHYYSQGSLSARLHGSRDSGKRPLPWNIRLKIAVDAARGVAHIHRKDEHKLVHGNITCSNILLYNQHYGIVSDVGLGNLVSPRKPFDKHNVGYCDPEVTNIGKVSQASDVYSLGVVLLELLSGRSPHETYKGDAALSVNRIQAVVREEWASQVFDEELLRNKDVEEEMVRMMQIAMRCVDSILENRPKMANVVKMLEEIVGL